MSSSAVLAMAGWKQRGGLSQHSAPHSGLKRQKGLDTQRPRKDGHRDLSSVTSKYLYGEVQCWYVISLAAGQPRRLIYTCGSESPDLGSRTLRERHREFRRAYVDRTQVNTR